MYLELGILALFIFCYSLVAGRIERAAALISFNASCILLPISPSADALASRVAIALFADCSVACNLVASSGISFCTVDTSLFAEIISSLRFVRVP